MLKAGMDLEHRTTPFDLVVESSDALPGIYLFDVEAVQNVPLESNNKAHYVSGEFVQGLMKDAAAKGLYIPLPLWPAVFADLTPPNLYQLQKERYDGLFRARRSN